MTKITVYCFQSSSHGEAVGFLKFFLNDDQIPDSVKDKFKQGWQEGAPMCEYDLQKYQSYLISSGIKEKYIQRGTLTEYISNHPELQKPSPFKEHPLWTID